MLFDLLDESFPGIKENVIRRRAVGFNWQSKAFTKEINGEIVSHVGLLDYPIIIEKQLTKVAALHAVCTKATYRQQGLASELIHEALAFAQSEYDSVVLFTEIPAFYEKLGFKKLKEYRFNLSYEHQKASSGSTRASLPRPLMVPEDNTLFIKSFENRSALSDLLWMQDQGLIASFNSLFMTYPTYWSLYHLASLECLISYEIKERTLHLYDVIAKNLPTLEDIVKAIPHTIDQIYFYFSPDKFTDAATAQAFLYDHGTLMLYGKPLTSKPFMISPLSRC